MRDKGGKKICEISAPDEDERYLPIEHVVTQMHIMVC